MLGLRKFFEAIHSEPDSEFEANTSPGLRRAALLRGTCAPLDVKCGSLSHLLSTAFIQQLYTQKYNKLALANTAVFVRVLGGRDGLSHSGKIVGNLFHVSGLPFFLAALLLAPISLSGTPDAEGASLC